MRKFLLLLSVMGIVLASCDIETSDNGKLDGYWHLVSADTLATQGHTDLSQQRIFWAVQVNLIQLRGTEQELYCRFSHQADELTINQLHLKDREKGDPEVTEEYKHFIYPYGINDYEEYFKVIQLTNEKMTLQSPTLRLDFQKM